MNGPEKSPRGFPNHEELLVALESAATWRHQSDTWSSSDDGELDRLKDELAMFGDSNRVMEILRCYREMGRAREGVNFVLEDMGHRDPETLQNPSSEFLEHIALAWHDAGEYGKAIGSAEDALTHDPEAVSCHYIRGVSAERVGDHGMARESLRAYLDRSPCDARAWITLAEASRKLGNIDDAAEYVERAENIGDDSADLLRAQGHILQENGDIPRAESQYLEAFSREPATEESLLQLAEFYDAHGHSSTCDRVLRFAGNLFPTSVELASAAAELCKKHGNLRDAVVHLERAVEQTQSRTIALRLWKVREALGHLQNQQNRAA